MRKEWIVLTRHPNSTTKRAGFATLDLLALSFVCKRVGVFACVGRWVRSTARRFPTRRDAIYSLLSASPLRDNKNAPSARCIARHALGRGRTPCHHLTVALSNFEPSLTHHSFPRRMCCAKRRFMASRRIDDAHPFRRRASFECEERTVEKIMRLSRA